MLRTCSLQIFVMSFALLFGLFGFVTRSSAQTTDKKTRFLFMLDCSGSMWDDINRGGRQKIVVAKSILGRLVDSLQHLPNVEMALRVYGTSPKNKYDCKDTHLEVGFYDHNAEDIMDKVSRLEPSGTTPIAYSLTQGADDFPITPPGKNIIILLTDGIEECKGDPCAVSQSLQSRGVILRPFIIGLGMSMDYSKYFGCVGTYFNATNENDLKNILNTVVTQALNNTTLQVYLNDINGKPTETDVDMTFYDARNKTVAYNIYHTMNASGMPDTLKIDPLAYYNLVVQTTPPVYQNDIELKPAKHNIISLEAPQGKLQLKVKNNGSYVLKCLVKKAGQKDIVYIQDFNSTHKYIVGAYDLEALTLPRTRITKVNIEQSQTTDIEVPQPGKLELSYLRDVVGSIYVMRNNKQEWVIDVTGAGSERKELFNLQPGNYKVIYRPKNSHNTIETKSLDVKIESGTFTTMSLQ